MVEFSKRLKKAMEQNNISQSELCEKTHIPKSAMSQYVSGAFKPKQDRVYLMAKALGVNEAWLMGFPEVSMEPSSPIYEEIEEINEKPGRKSTQKALFSLDSEAKVSSTSEPPNVVAVQPGKIRMIPVFESVSAGFGSFASSEIVGYAPFFISSDTEAEETIALKVKGDSMSPRIEDGDLIQVHRQDYIDSGDIAVVLIGDEGRVKQVNYGETWLELISFNDEYPPQRFVREEMNDVRIIGKVRSVCKEL